MRISRKIEIEEVSGAWIMTVGNGVGEHSQAYSQTGPQDYVRFIKDLIKEFDLQNVLEVKERV